MAAKARLSGMFRPRMATEAFAPAKVNLTLHVTGRRADGYHLLDSLVAFADIGDLLTFAPADGRTTTLTVTGPFAQGVPCDGSNLVLRAAAMMQGPPLAITLDKRLPPASGVGGGSADAAATLRALAAMGYRPGDADFAASLLALGADLPVCHRGLACRMSGIGEHLGAAPVLPPAWLVLANPGCPVPTRDVFAALQGRFGPDMGNTLPDRFADAADLARWLQGQRNDLEAAAIAVVPPVQRTLQALRASPGCLLARMSGSGATCFGLFATPADASTSAALLARAEPGWWVAKAPLRH